MVKKHLTEQGLQSQKLEALGLFAGGIAHDFNNILSIIEGYTHIAIKQLKEGTLTPDQLKKIILSTQRGAGLTRQLLAFGRQKIDLEERVNIVEILRQQHILMKPLLGGAISVYMMLPEEAVWVKASTDQMSQVIMNIAINARDAMPDGGELAIICGPCIRNLVPKELQRNNPNVNFVKVSLIDSGGGIDPSTMPRIFDPFFTTKSVSRGTGLGLSVVHGIIKQIGGDIVVQSKPEEGTCFDLYIPMTAPPERSVQVPELKTHDALSGKTILVAEDEPELRDVLVTMLDGMEMKVLSASNGNQALLVQEEYDGEIDFLLTDVVMPEMNGVRLGELFQALRPQSDIVYMSGYPFVDINGKTSIPDGAAFIDKPLQEERIRKVLERALERRDARLKGER